MGKHASSRKGNCQPLAALTWEDERVHAVMGLVQYHEGEYRHYHNPYVMSKAKPLVTRGCMLAEPLQRPRPVGLQTTGSPCCTPYVVSKAKPQVPTVRALRPWRLARPHQQPQPVGLLARNQSLPSSTSTQMQTMVVYAEAQTDEPPAKIAKRFGDESSLRLGGWH